MWKYADIPKVRCTPPANSNPVLQSPTSTMWVWHVQECKCTQVRCNPSHNPHQLNPVLHTPTTPYEFDMWKNTDVPSSDVHPPLIKPNAKELYYTMSVWYVKECRFTKVRCTLPPLIKPSATHPYYTMWMWHVDVYIWIQVRCTSSPIEPSATESYYTMSIWHVEECRHTQVRCTPPTNWTQC